MTLSKTNVDLLQGTLDLLILRTLLTGPQHGWGISQRIQQTSEDVLRVNQGSLYPALHRLEGEGWIDAEWGASENNRKARFYRLTRSGIRQNRLYWLAPARRLWRSFTGSGRGALRTRLWHPLLDATRPMRHKLGLKYQNLVPVFWRRFRNRGHWLD